MAPNIRAAHRAVFLPMREIARGQQSSDGVSGLFAWDTQKRPPDLVVATGAIAASDWRYMSEKRGAGV